MSIPKTSAWSWNIYLWSNLIAEGGCGWWKPWANTLAYWKLNWNALDSSWNNNTLTLTWFTFDQDNTCAITNAQLSNAENNLVFKNANVQTWDFCVNMWFYPVAPASDRYPMLYWEWNDSSSPWIWINIFFDPYWRTNVSWDWITFRTTLLSEHKSSTPASQLYNWWHNVIFTRLNWICYAYIDSILVITPFSDNTDISSRSSRSTVMSRAEWSYSKSSQTRWVSWAKFDDIILEKVWRTEQEAVSYYKKTKSKYWIS